MIVSRQLSKQLLVFSIVVVYQFRNQAQRTEVIRYGMVYG